MNANAPAFPAQEFSQVAGANGSMAFGLTKREYFAAMAMQGMFSANVEDESTTITKWAVEAADALIAELSK